MKLLRVLFPLAGIAVLLCPISEAFAQEIADKPVAVCDEKKCEMSKEDFERLKGFHAHLLRLMVEAEVAIGRAEGEAETRRQQLIRRGMDCKTREVKG